MKDGEKTNMVMVELDHPYVKNDADRKAWPDNTTISGLLIRHAVFTKWEKSMPRTDSRIWAPIQEDLEAKPARLALSKTDFDWLFEQVSECDYPAPMSPWRWTFLNYLEKLKMGTETADKAPPLREVTK